MADISRLSNSFTHDDDDDFENWTMGEASLSWKSECPLPPCVAAIEIYGRALNRNIYQDNIATLLDSAAALLKFISLLTVAFYWRDCSNSTSLVCWVIIKSRYNFCSFERNCIWSFHCKFCQRKGKYIFTAASLYSTQRSSTVASIDLAKVELLASEFIDAIENQLLIFWQRWMDWINNKATAKIHLFLE